MKRTLLVLLTVVLVAQFFQPDRTVQANDPEHDLITVTQPGPEIRDLLQSACYDCHSDRTTYPWYSYITPINFWMQDHIDEGRAEFDMSSWGRRRAKWQRHKAEESAEMISEGEMPLPSYTWVHGEARLNAAQRSALEDFFLGLKAAIPAEAENTH
ncbi:MAG TPA: heme-binding domain-containing protein [Flavobacteriales bacterium]|nr:heme-binding domain-containing protein [Flavobacteriales bacterium]